MISVTRNTSLSELSDYLEPWLERCRPASWTGKTAAYIPELAKAPPHTLAIEISYVHNGVYSTTRAGNHGFTFTLQSISKVFALLLALLDHGEDVVFQKVGMEPTGDSFNSMLKLELIAPGFPFNPYINAGAIAICSLIKGKSSEEKAERLLHFIRKLAGNERLSIDMQTCASEAATADLNRSIAYLLKQNGVIHEEVEEVLDVYFRQCSIMVTCSDLARIGLILAYDGLDPVTSTRVIPKRYAQIAKALMMTCGMYNASGQFAIQAGIPAKSGVSGGILAIVPGQFGIGVVGPSLNEKGNSVAGVKLLEQLSRHFEWSLF